MRLILFGAPGAGKGTLAALLKEQYGLAHISTGDMLREEMRSGSSLGNQIKQFIEKGELVPDEVVTKLIEQKLTNGQSLSQGFMLDGFPRTQKQAEDLDRILKKVNSSIDFALYLESSRETIIKRLSGRRVCKKCGALFNKTFKPPKKEGVCDACGGELYQRSDDNEQTIKNRLQVYLENTAPIMEYYRRQNKLKTEDVEDGVEHVARKFKQL